MKKTMALLLAVVMALSLVSVVYAADAVSGDADNTDSEATPEAATDPEEATPEAATDPEEDTPEAAADPEEDTPEAAADPEEDIPEAAAIVTEEDTSETTETASQEDGTGDDPTVYSVDISWTVTAAAYESAGDIYTWDTDTLQYVKDTDRLGDTLTETTPGSITITVTNNSSAAVAYSIDYTSATTDDESEISEVSTDSSASGSLNAAASATYNATVKLKTNDEGVVTACTQAAAGDLTMGTYTVSIKDKISFTYWYSFNGSITTYDFEAKPGQTFADWYFSTDDTSQLDSTVMANTGASTKEELKAVVDADPDCVVNCGTQFTCVKLDNTTDHNSQGDMTWDTELTDGLVFGYYFLNKKVD